jgi:hypothetical protein
VDQEESGGARGEAAGKGGCGEGAATGVAVIRCETAATSQTAQDATTTGAWMRPSQTERLPQPQTCPLPPPGAHGAESASRDPFAGAAEDGAAAGGAAS